ncbi:MAG: M14 family metallocarboxypeptidase [Chloroflexi bacterium]|nr:M14 family metallocarboxypeptidase [Chloroflexota bacterium]
MKRKWFILALGILLLLSLSCASGHKESLPETLPLVRDVSAVQSRLATAVSSCDSLSMKTIGQVSYGTYQAPVWVVSFSPAVIKRKALLSGGIHGNEPAGVEVMVQMVEMLAKNPHEYGSIAFDIIPIVNPWGWSHDVRFNQEGRDVNRDFATFKCQESAIIRDFASGKRYDLIIDDHEDPNAKGFYMYQYANPDTWLSRKLINTVRGLGYPIEQDVNMIILKTDDGLVNAPLWGLWYMKLTGQLSITNYFRLNNSSKVYTIETPTKLDWEDRLKVHMIALEILLDSLQTTTR